MLSFCTTYTDIFVMTLRCFLCAGCNDIDVIVLFTSGPHLRHNYHGNKTLETMLSGSVEFVGHRLNRPVLLHLCVCRVLPINNATPSPVVVSSKAVTFHLFKLCFFHPIYY